MAKTDGGPAFPFYRPEMRAAGGKVIRSHDERDGMSLRDWFAGQVVGAYLYERFSGNRTWEPEEIAAWSYETADAMLAEREK